MKYRILKIHGKNNLRKYVHSFKGFITYIIIQMDAPVKYDNQGLKSSSLAYKLIHANYLWPCLWQTVSETVDSVSICAETTGKKFSNNCVVTIETFVPRRRDVTKPLSSLAKSFSTVKSLIIKRALTASLFA